MSTPGTPPSAIWNLEIDEPLVQDAEYRFNKNDRAYIDSQILGLETLVLPLVGGSGSSGPFNQTGGTGGVVVLVDPTASVALGTSSVATGTNSFASGASTASGTESIAVGGSTASGSSSAAFGSGQALNTGTLAAGAGVAQGFYATAVSGGLAYGNSSFAACQATANSDQDFAAGVGSVSTGDGSVGAVAFGGGQATHDGAFAACSGVATGLNSMAFGACTVTEDAAYKIGTDGGALVSLNADGAGTAEIDAGANGILAFGNVLNQTTVGAAGVASATPASPDLYLLITIPGLGQKAIALFAPS